MSSLEISVDQLPPDLETADFPTPTQANFEAWHGSGLRRYGIVAAILNRSGELLLLEHAQSEKTEAGLMGPLAETAHVSVDPTARERLAIEPVTTTLYRGILEEIGVSPSALSYSRSHSYFDVAWPIGGIHRGKAMARCPIVFVDAVTEASIINAEPTEEIRDARFVSLASLDDVHSLEQPVQGYRLGVDQWLKSGMPYIMHAAQEAPEQLRTLKIEPWLTTGPVQDAIFDRVLENI